MSCAPFTEIFICEIHTEQNSEDNSFEGIFASLSSAVAIAVAPFFSLMLLLLCILHAMLCYAMPCHYDDDGRTIINTVSLSSSNIWLRHMHITTNDIEPEYSKKTSHTRSHTLEIRV